MEYDNKREIVSKTKRRKLDRQNRSNSNSESEDKEKKCILDNRKFSVLNRYNDDTNFIQHLPVELLTHTFSYLQRNDVINAASTCKHWRKIIFNSPELWRKCQITIRCFQPTKKLNKAKSFCKIFGRYLRHIKIRCAHSQKHRCRSMAYAFQQLLKCVQTKHLNTFQVSHLKISQGKVARIKPVCDAVCRLLLSQKKLTSFHMSKSHWPEELGISLMTSLSHKFSKSLTSVKLDEFFCPTSLSPPLENGHNHFHNFSNALISLDRLSHLTINYQYLNDHCIMGLANHQRKMGGRGGANSRPPLTSLELIATDITPITSFVSTNAWTTLMECCPGLKVEFRIRGHVISPSVSIPAILDPVMRINKLDLDIGPYFTINGNRLSMVNILRYITINFRKRLVKFTLNIDNKSESIDKAVIKLVRRCKYLINVKVIGHFSNYDVTQRVIKDIIKGRRKRTTSTGSKQRGGDRPSSDNGTASSSINDSEDRRISGSEYGASRSSTSGGGGGHSGGGENSGEFSGVVSNNIVSNGSGSGGISGGDVNNSGNSCCRDDDELYIRTCAVGGSGSGSGSDGISTSCGSSSGGGSGGNDSYSDGEDEDDEGLIGYGESSGSSDVSSGFSGIFVGLLDSDDDD